ncbi:hypothetical protein B0T20DRAFT_396218 [Sordaria brevicollis]|uniref:Uncharacterized protein n=1 Tax=Sordaria brevicollis TaxID=83679 RepID=A0AAE0P3D1_SORBR|nr:hypothetical protein B0T20DRAFT_396218 [Sordaria brevicollis]
MPESTNLLTTDFRARSVPYYSDPSCVAHRLAKSGETSLPVGFMWEARGGTQLAACRRIGEKSWRWLDVCEMWSTVDKERRVQTRAKVISHIEKAARYFLDKKLLLMGVNIYRLLVLTEEEDKNRGNLITRIYKVALEDNFNFKYIKDYVPFKTYNKKKAKKIKKENSSLIEIILNNEGLTALIPYSPLRKKIKPPPLKKGKEKAIINSKEEEVITVIITVVGKKLEVPTNRTRVTVTILDNSSNFKGINTPFKKVLAFKKVTFKKKPAFKKPALKKKIIFKSKGKEGKTAGETEIKAENEFILFSPFRIELFNDEEEEEEDNIIDNAITIINIIAVKVVRNKRRSIELTKRNRYARIRREMR